MREHDEKRKLWYAGYNPKRIRLEKLAIWAVLGLFCFGLLMVGLGMAMARG